MDNHPEPSVIYWERRPSPLGYLTVALTSQGVCRLSFPNEGPAEVQAALKVIFPRAAVKEKPGIAGEIFQQLEEYFSGRRRTFEVTLDLRGTPFQLRVWKTLRAIPYGTTLSYGEVARSIGKPKAARAVGRAVGSNPVGIIVPCHRVIETGGGLGGFGGGLEIKEKLLRLEGALSP
ncbi:MAG TPA: [Fe-S]-binding protein [Peptococcaceae bacterium]|nr:MAG: Methylated-DNA--protein-cysteine methyltransferase [Moorella sp. 60_41]HBT48004.1 [Fe-S]-binding protein [Peptococcaceae bacterium]